MKSFLKIPQDSTIMHAPKPLPLCSKTDITKLPIETLNAIIAKQRGHAFTWVADLLVPETIEMSKTDEVKVQQLLQRRIPSENLVLCYLDNQVGHGVFCIDKIAKGQIIIYAGRLTPQEPGAYNMMAEKGQAWNASHEGDYSALLQDLYSPEAPLEGFPLKVARNNFVSNHLKLDNISLCYPEASLSEANYLLAGVEHSIQYPNNLTMSIPNSLGISHHASSAIKSPSSSRSNLFSPVPSPVSTPSSGKSNTEDALDELVNSFSKSIKLSKNAKPFKPV